MYTKRRTLTIPVEYKEVVVPHDKIPDDADVRFLYHGQEVQGTPTSDGVLIAYSDNADEDVTIEYGYKEKEEHEDVVTPIVEALRAIPTPKEADIQPVVDALGSVEQAIYATQKEEKIDERVPALLQSIRDALLEKKTEERDGSSDAMLGYIADKIPIAVDTTEIVTLLRGVLDKLSIEQIPVPQLDFPRDEYGRIKVEVDRTGFGGLTGKESNTLESVKTNSANILIALTQQYTLIIDDEYPITYIGETVPGTATSVGEWRIKKIDETTVDTTIKYAGGGAFDQAWDNRASLTYA